MDRSWLHDSGERALFPRHDAGPYSRERSSFQRYYTVKFAFEFGLLTTTIFIVAISVIW